MPKHTSLEQVKLSKLELMISGAEKLFREIRETPEPHRTIIAAYIGLMHREQTQHGRAYAFNKHLEGIAKLNSIPPLDLEVAKKINDTMDRLKEARIEVQWSAPERLILSQRGFNGRVSASVDKEPTTIEIGLHTADSLKKLENKLLKIHPKLDYRTDYGLASGQETYFLITKPEVMRNPKVRKAIEDHLGLL